MVGESGGTYYARPGQPAVFNGDRAYESYQGRNEALAIDVYDNIVQLARPKLTFFSPAETAWFGIEHLNVGYHDFSRLPNATDGVWFKPFEEGKPGVQPERLPPYVCTFNPGWDPDLPLYRPLPMFIAEQAAQAPDGPEPCVWDHRPEIKQTAVVRPPATIERVAYIGARDGELSRRLVALGLPLAEGPIQTAQLLVVDAETLTADLFSAAKAAADATLANEGTVLVIFRKAGEVTLTVTQFLPASVTLTSRHATSLVRASRTPGLPVPN